MPPQDDRVLVLVQEPARSQGHPFMWLGIGTGVLVGLIYWLRGRPGWGGHGGGLLGPGTPDATPVPVTTIPHDADRLTFLMTTPKIFRGPDGKTYSLHELIVRVAAGGRMDVALKIPGNILEGDYLSAKALIKSAGIEVLESPPAVSGWYQSSRGAYR